MFVCLRDQYLLVPNTCSWLCAVCTAGWHTMRHIWVYDPIRTMMFTWLFKLSSNQLTQQFWILVVLHLNFRQTYELSSNKNVSGFVIKNLVKWEVRNIVSKWTERMFYSLGFWGMINFFSLIWIPVVYFQKSEPVFYWMYQLYCQW